MRYRPDGQRINFAVHLFFYITLMFGLAFVLPPEWLGTGASELFHFSQVHGVAFWWGMAMLVTTALNTIMLGTRNTVLAQYAAMVGFLCWAYAFIAYAIQGFWFGLLVGAVPNLAFWIWYYFQTQYYRRTYRR